MIKHQILVLLPILPMFSVLSADYGQSAFAPDFDPWTHVDVFSRSLNYKSLLLSYNVVKAGPKVGAVRVETSESSGVIGKSTVQIPSAFKRKQSVELARLLHHSWRKRQCSDLRTKCTYVFVYSSNCIFC